MVNGGLDRLEHRWFLLSLRIEVRKLCLRLREDTGCLGCLGWPLRYHRWLSTLRELYLRLSASVELKYRDLWLLLRWLRKQAWFLALARLGKLGIEAWSLLCARRFELKCCGLLLLLWLHERLWVYLQGRKSALGSTGVQLGEHGFRSRVLVASRGPGTLREISRCWLI